MTVNTKYNVGDRLYYIEEGFVYLNEVVVVNIESTRNKPEPSIHYIFASNPRAKLETEVASSKEELIKILPVREISLNKK